MTSIDVFVWKASMARHDGGGKRVASFLDAFRRIGIDINIIAIGPDIEESSRLTTSSAVHALKREYFPAPFIGGIRRELALVASARKSDVAVSLLLPAHRWVLDHYERCWLDFPDLWSSYCRNGVSSGKPAVEASRRLQAELWSRREASYSARATVATAAGLEDSEALVSGSSWVPSPVFSAKSSPPQGIIRRDNRRVVFGYLANFSYPPNISGYEYLIQDVLPLLRELGAELVVAGFDSHQLAAPPDVRVMGEVARVWDFYSAIDVALAPISTGGGMKVKVIEAMAYGKPVVGTTHAFDNLPAAVRAAGLTLPEALISSQELPLTDPREDPLVRAELSAFSDESFFEEVASLWRTMI